MIYETAPEVIARAIKEQWETVFPDAPTPAEMAAAFGAQYQNIPLDQITSPDMHAMYTFLSEQGYAVDPVAVRARYPEVAWVSFAAWAAALKL